MGKKTERKERGKDFVRQSAITGRVVVLLLLAAVQFMWIVALFMDLIVYSRWVSIAFEILRIFMLLYLVNKDEAPEYRLIWVILMAVLPIFGALMYLMFGNKRPTRRMSRLISEQEAANRYLMEKVDSKEEALKDDDRRTGQLAQLIHTIAESPVYQQTDATYFPNGESCVETLLADLESAERFIFIEFFIIAEGEFKDLIFEVLERKAQAGVDVRVMYDDFGSIMRLPGNFDQLLEDQGIRCLKFNPFTPIISLMANTRNHRKMINVDGRIGYTGGINLADEYINAIERFGYWKDNVVRIEGPAVWNFTFMFLDMWNAFYPLDANYEAFEYSWSQEELQTLEAKVGQSFVQPFKDTPLDDEPIGEDVYIDIIDIAEDYVYIYTPYLIVSFEMQSALIRAAHRGVDVRIITPGIPDKRIIFRVTQSYYPALLKAGVRIFEYTPGFIHAKTFISDDRILNIGSMNLDYRSLYLNFEAATMFYNHPILNEAKADYLATLSQSKEIKLADTHQGFFGQFFEALLRVAAPLF